MNHCFPNNQYIILQRHAWTKDSLRIQERAVDFNMRQFENFNNVFHYYTVIF